jgi:prepilin-type N-terminal cleavage/methylation domain-containing protein
MEVRFMNKKGVTLLELIVVMVIIGIGAVLFTPNISGWMRSYRLRSATRDIVSTMRTAQMKAVSTNTIYQVSFTLPVSYVLQYQDAGGNFVTEGATQTLPSGISIAAVNFAANNAVFNPNSTSSTGSITLQNSKTQRKLTLTPSTGRVTISQPGE